MCHLILDEMNSAVNLSGRPFVPKKSLGTALQLWANSTFTTLAVYIALLFFIFLKVDIFILLLNN